MIDDLTTMFPEIEGLQRFQRTPEVQDGLKICRTLISHILWLSWNCDILRFDDEVILALNNVGKAIGAVAQHWAWNGTADTPCAKGTVAKILLFFRPIRNQDHHINISQNILEYGKVTKDELPINQ